MNILMCNERFLFRFGMDRTLILLGQHLTTIGHRVSAMAHQGDRAVLEGLFSRVIDVPVQVDDYLRLDELTAAWLETAWNECFAHAAPPEVVVVGGWPFFSAIPFLRRTGAAVVFVDFGAVPLDGYSGGALAVQEQVRRLRRRYLGEASLVIAISEFIARSQSRIDVGDKVPVLPVLLGADHLETPTWSADRVSPGRSRGELDRRLAGRRTVLALGRWEPGCYKNSEAAFEVLDRLRADVPDAALLILDEPAKVTIPGGLRDAVFPIGYPDDAALVDLMRRVDLGISVSRWEGFNLPLAEMQWLGRPALAFDLAAHPEVVVHPWYLCRDTAEMAAKASAVLLDRGLDAAAGREASARFRDRFRWRRFTETCADAFAGLVRETSRPVAPGRQPAVIVDVTNATRDPANPGVIRVSRRVGRELQRHVRPLFVVWDDALATYVLPTLAEYRQLGQFNGPEIVDGAPVSDPAFRTLLTELPGWRGPGPTWLLLTETLSAQRAPGVVRFARAHGLALAAIFYDAIPVLHPEWCNEEIVGHHAQYMRSLSGCDVLLPISHFSGTCLTEFWKQEGLHGGLVRPHLLPGEFGGGPRATEVRAPSGDEVKILCVSTLEPRKNHLGLVRACLHMQERFPTLAWSLTMVGNRYAGASDIIETIEALAATNPRIRWLGVVDDAELVRRYRDATFTVYPSFIEGFGMPILESLWHGRPCICSRENALGELASGGGCLPTDVRDEQALADAIHRLATDRGLLATLTEEAVQRKITTWNEYVEGLLSILAINEGGIMADVTPITQNARDWSDIVYPGCLRENWQMHDSERLALTALLARRRPRCAIEIGTYQGGSLSLLSQYCEMVFSIDIDPDIPQKLRHLNNVSFLTGPSSAVLPLLFKELDANGIPVEFILIDADHSAEGVRGDIERVLEYVPRTPLLVAAHDSFNPDCRQGMLEARWSRSPYVQWVDLDLVPGRLVENGGPFHRQLWGGLALAYLSPDRRVRDLELQRSADGMFQAMNEYAQRAR